MENTNISITSDFVESIIKANHIFNNLLLTSKPQVIKTSPKFNMVIVWVDIWNAQSEHNTKNMINRYFNVKSYIMIIHSTNMNPSVP